MYGWCRYTRGRFERTHGDVLNPHTEGRGSSSMLLTKICPRMVITWPQRSTKSYHRILPIQGLRTSREQHVPESSNHSLYLMKLLRDTAEGISTHTHIRNNTYSPTHPPTDPPTTTPLPSLPPSPTRPRTRKRTCTCTCIRTCTCI